MTPSPTKPSAAPKPRRGRPRSAEADSAILTATIELAGEVGINGMSMDDVADRAGVSKTTIYRRWPNKEALVLDALGSAMRPLDDVDTGDLRDDLVIYLSEVSRRMENGKSSDVLPHLIEAGCHDPAIAESLDAYVQFRRQPLRRIFKRAIERGELAADADIDILIDAVIGPFVYRRLLTHDRIDADFTRRLLDIVVPAVTN